MKKMMIILLTLSVSLICTVSLFAEETVKLNANQYIIDNTNLMILTNANVDEINSKVKSKISRIELDKTWLFKDEVERLEVGKEYFIYTVENSQDVFSLYFTELPIIHITTNNTIVDEPDVLAKFSMVQSNNEYIESFVGIQYRGKSSQQYPKKSMEIKFYKDETLSKKVDYALLGMRKDESWNLQAMYIEPFRCRNKVGFDLWRKINNLHYADLEPKATNGVRHEYSELFLNNEYRGIYCVSEKLDRKQLALKKYDKKTHSIHGELYKAVGWINTNFDSLLDYDNTLDMWGEFEYKYPKEKIDWANLYDAFKFVIKTTNEEFYSECSQRFDTDNMADYFIFLNIICGEDNTGKNIYIAKYDNGTPYFYQPWDLDAIFGNNWKGEPSDCGKYIHSNWLLTRLTNDKTPGGFWDKVKLKWKKLRDEGLSSESIFDMLKQNHDYLKRNATYEREARVWTDYKYKPELLSDLSSWLTKRMDFLDSLFEYEKSNVIAINSDDFIITNDADFIYIKTSKQDYKVSIYNIFGRLIYSEQSFSGDAMLSSQSIPMVYLLSIRTKSDTLIELRIKSN